MALRTFVTLRSGLGGRARHSMRAVNPHARVREFNRIGQRSHAPRYRFFGKQNAGFAAAAFGGAACMLAAAETTRNPSLGECKATETEPPSALRAPVKTVVILMAMRQEAEPFIERHGLKQIRIPGMDQKLPFVAYEGRLFQGDGAEEGLQVYLVWTGNDKRFGRDVNNVATTASTLSAYVSIQAFRPNLLLSCGTAGGFKCFGGKIGDVYVSSKCVFHSRRIPASGNEYMEYSYGHYRSPPVPLLAKKTGCKIGVVSTSDSLDCTGRDLEIMAQEGAAVKEMEAASIAWVARELQVPFFAVKSITDIVDDKTVGAQGQDTLAQFEENLKTASASLQTKLSLLLESLHGTSLSDWRGKG
jgi:5'-methylthioadenosine nucleosidase